MYEWSSDRYYRRGKGPEWPDLGIVLLLFGRGRRVAVRRLQRLPARPGLLDIMAATLSEFGVAEGDLRCRRHTPARLALAFLARHEGALKLPEFAPALGVHDWAASHMATSADRLAQESRRFKQSLRRIQLSLAKVTDSQTWPRVLKSKR